MRFKTPRTWAAAIMVPVSVAALAGCGDDGGSAGSDGAGTSSISTDVPADYDGPDASSFETLEAPTEEEGTSFKVGYLGVSTSQPALVAMQEAAQTEVEALGGSFVAKDAQLDPQRQVSQMNELLAEDVDIIICGPVFAEALVPSIEQATAAGIPFITVAGSTGPDDVVPGAAASITQGFDYIAYRTVKAVADENPGASFATMGLGAPVAVVAYLTERQEFWADELGLDFLGNVDTTEDSPSAYSAAASTILTRYPDIDVISTYNDQAAIAIGTTVSTQGSDASVVSANAGQSITGDALEAGRLELVYRTPWEEIGRQAAYAAYYNLIGQGDEVAPYIVVPSYIVTADEAGDAVWVD